MVDWRAAHERERRATEQDRRLWQVLLGVLLPLACFATAIALDRDIGPDWQREEFSAYANTLFHRSVFPGFAALVAFAAVALLCVVFRAERAGKSRWVRIGLWGGVVVSAQYAIASFATWHVFPLLFGGIPVAGTWLTRLLLRVQLPPLAASIIAIALLGVVALGFAVFRDEHLAGLGLLGALSMGPLLSLLTYALTLRRLDRVPLGRAAPLAWGAAYGASWVWAVERATEYYASLPTHSGCFIVSAAARFVPVRQLLLLKAGELQLARWAPQTHRALRAVYDRVGPPIAARISTAPRARVVHTLCKPLEWLVILLCPAAARRLIREA